MQSQGRLEWCRPCWRPPCWHFLAYLFQCSAKPRLAPMKRIWKWGIFQPGHRVPSSSSAWWNNHLSMHVHTFPKISLISGTQPRETIEASAWGKGWNPHRTFRRYQQWRGLTWKLLQFHRKGRCHLWFPCHTRFLWYWLFDYWRRRLVVLRRMNPSFAKTNRRKWVLNSFGELNSWRRSILQCWTWTGRSHRTADELKCWLKILLRSLHLWP